MSNEEQNGSGRAEIPSDAIVAQQAAWAWMWSAVPWIVFFVVSMFIDFFSFGIFPLVLALIVIVPRYLSYRRTSYVLTDEHLVIQEGTLMGQHRIDLLITDLGNLDLHPGMFGSTLGYTGVNLQLKDGRRAVLRYVPANSPLISGLRSMISE